MTKAKRVKSIKREKRSSAGKVARVKPAGVKRSPAVHVSPDDFVSLRRDSVAAKAPSLSKYVSAALLFSRGKLLWLADGRVRVRT